MRIVIAAGAALVLFAFQEEVRAKQESAFADDGLKLADELLKKGFAPEARFLAGLVGSRVASAKERADRVIEQAKSSKAKPAGKDAETRVPAFGKKWAGEWRKLAKGGGAAGARLEVEAEILDAVWEHARAFALFNRRRAEAGVGTVDYDFGLAYGCQMHARYLVKHPKTEDPHTESKDADGFSPQGSSAAENSVIDRNAPLALDPDLQLATVFHRAKVLSPSTIRIGAGYSKIADENEWSVIDIISASIGSPVTVR